MPENMKSLNGYGFDASMLNGKTDSEYASSKSLSQLKDDLADAWTAGKTYVVGEYCISGNRLYKCKTAHTAGSAFDASYWDAVSAAAEIKSIADAYSNRIKTYFGSNITITMSGKSKLILLIVKRGVYSGAYILNTNSFGTSAYYTTIVNCEKAVLTESGLSVDLALDDQGNIIIIECN